MPNILKLCPMDLQARTRYIKDALAEEGSRCAGYRLRSRCPEKRNISGHGWPKGNTGRWPIWHVTWTNAPILAFWHPSPLVNLCGHALLPGKGTGSGATEVARYAALGKFITPSSETTQRPAPPPQSLFPVVQGRAFTDSAPVLERYWAAPKRTGLGGQERMLLNQHLWFAHPAGRLILNIELEYDHPVPNRCGNCTRCLEACPTGALTGPARMDARKCLSYLTIEFQGSLEKTDLHGRFFGCDLCQDACPWNRALPACSEPGFQAIPEILKFSPEQWHSLSQDAFADIFVQSPLMRAGLEKLKTHLSYPDKPETS